MIPALTKGGAERVAVDLANVSARDGHNVTLIVGWKVDENILRVRVAPEVRIVYMSEANGIKLSRYLTALRWTLINRRWIAEQDVLHLHLTQSAVCGTVVYGLRTMFRETTPAIIETYHAVGMKIPVWARAFHAWNCRQRDGIALIALDPYWRSFIERSPASLFDVIPNGIDAPIGPEPLNHVRDYLNSIGVPGSAARIIGTVGQFRSDRRPLTIARILIEVVKQSPEDLHVIMCGSGPEFGRVKYLIESEGVSDRFTLPGIVNEPRRAISAMSLYLAINVGDITGIAALEAAFCGVPIVAFQFDHSHRAEKDWIWSSSDPTNVTQKITTLLNAREKIARIGADQHAHAVASHSAKKMGERYHTFYRRVLKTRESRNPISKE